MFRPHNGGHSGASHGGSSHADGGKGGTQVAQNHNVKTGVGIGVGTVDVLGNAVKTSKSKTLNQGWEKSLLHKTAKEIGKDVAAAINAAKKAAMRIADPIARQQALEHLEKARTAVGQAKAGGAVRRGPR
ncbi:hypothetical protein CQ062_19620 [Ochrobactrum sp. MYb68]|nr:hypothetical protein CQ062_19620 [Ochrobactrum sp. MYb68]